MNDMSAVIVPKSDQLNSDDLIAGPMTIQITGVNIKPGGEQPVAISFSGDNNKPWKPCKSMSRILVAAWGPDAKKYVGRSLTLYRDPGVKWAGLEVGGIRISHMSDIEGQITMALTATRGSRKPHTVRVLAAAQTSSSAVAPTIAEYESCATHGPLEELEQRRSAVWKSLKPEQQKQLKAASDAAKARLAKPSFVDHELWIGTLKGQTVAAELEKSWTAYVDECGAAGVETHPDAEDAYKAVKTLMATVKP